MNILFWNLRRNPITGYVKECLLENQVDIAVFAEHEGIDWRRLITVKPRIDRLCF